MFVLAVLLFGGVTVGHTLAAVVTGIVTALKGLASGFKSGSGLMQALSDGVRALFL